MKELDDLKKVMTLDESIVCVNSPDGLHHFKIIRGSGKKTGTPVWKCEGCKITTKSS